MEIYDLIIIGGGPAGIAAGIYGARKALKTLLITKDFIGQTGATSLVDNYPGFPEISGIDLMGKFKEHLKKFPVEILEGQLVKFLAKTGEVFEIETAKGEKFQAKTVITCPGRRPRLLNIPGEQEFFGKGVSYCSTCDAIFFKNKVVAVVGGGNVGFEAAIDLLPFANKIYILELGSKIIADEISQKIVKDSGKVKVILRAKALEIKGKNALESLAYQNLNNNQAEGLEVQGVFIQIGSLPASDFLKDLVDFNQWGEIVVDPKTGATRTSGLFAAGDATDIRDKQIVIAAGEGVKALLSAYNYLQNLK